MKLATKIKIGMALLFMTSWIAFEGTAQQPGQEQDQHLDQYEHQAPGQQGVREDFTEEELQSFIDANKQAITVQQSAEQHMMDAIQNEGLDVNKFNEILTSRQNPEMKTEATEEDQAKFDSAVQKVMEIQEKMVSEMENAIKQSGMSIQEYEEMLLAYQQSPKVQQQVNEMLMRESDVGSEAGTE